MLEFLLNFDHDLPQKLPSPVCNDQSGCFEWTLPFRNNTGSITYYVEHTTNLSIPWSTEGITVNGDTYAVPLATAGYWRIRVVTN